MCLEKITPHFIEVRGRGAGTAGLGCGKADSVDRDEGSWWVVSIPLSNCIVCGMRISHFRFFFWKNSKNMK